MESIIGIQVPCGISRISTEDLEEKVFEMAKGLIPLNNYDMYLPADELDIHIEKTKILEGYNKLVIFEDGVEKTKSINLPLLIKRYPDILIKESLILTVEDMIMILNPLLDMGFTVNINEIVEEFDYKIILEIFFMVLLNVKIISDIDEKDSYVDNNPTKIFTDYTANNNDPMHPLGKEIETFFSKMTQLPLNITDFFNSAIKNASAIENNEGIKGKDLFKEAMKSYEEEEEEDK